jgi:hypothetical protein
MEHGMLLGMMNLGRVLTRPCYGRATAGHPKYDRAVDELLAYLRHHTA